MAGAEERFDTIVIGAGAGGSMAAKVLAAGGRSVLVLEKGPNRFRGLDDPAAAPVPLLGNDELRRLRGFWGQDAMTEPRTFRTAPSDGERLHTGIVQGLPSTVGGGTVLYDGNSPRCTRVDFRSRSLYGAIDGADLADWPIDYAELAPFYDEVERVVGIAGQAGADPFAEPRTVPYPMAPGDARPDSALLAEAAARLGLHPFPVAQARNSAPYRGRPPCNNCGFSPQGCAISSKGSSAVTSLRDALLTGRCTLRAESFVTGIETDAAGGTAVRARWIDPTGAERSAQADHFVLAGNAIESARLCLLSASTSHPDGLGNGSGRVGRDVQFHVGLVGVGMFDHVVNGPWGRPVTHCLSDFTMPPGGRLGGPFPAGFIRGGIVELGGQVPLLEEARRSPRGRPHVAFMRDSSIRARLTTVTMLAEDMPQLSNRVDLDPSVRDVYGRPVARITYRAHPRDEALARTYGPRLAEIVNEAGAALTLVVPLAIETGGVPSTYHLLGTLRMGDDPSNSVVDRWGAFHQVPNLHAADGSVFTTSIAWNPTLTIQALAYRTAAAILHPGAPEKALPSA